MNLYLGCPVWSFKGWVGNFYPKGTKPANYLREYARRLTTVEGNTTFYAVPAQKTLEAWLSEMPGTFRFCPKIPRVISHGGNLTDRVAEARGFIQVMSQLGSRLGPMFLQLPPKYSPRRFGDLKTFLEVWPPEVRLGVEVRHHDWFEAPDNGILNQLLSDHDMARVVIDTRPVRSLEGDKILEGSVYQTLLEAREQKPDVPILPERTAGFIFLRYIGHPQLEINQPFLDEWGEYLVSQIRDGADAYVFCHSPGNLIAPRLCREVYSRAARHVALPPLPWDKADLDTVEQGRLF